MFTGNYKKQEGSCSYIEQHKAILWNPFPTGVSDQLNTYLIDRFILLKGPDVPTMHTDLSVCTPNANNTQYRIAQTDTFYRRYIFRLKFLCPKIINMKTLGS